MNSFSKESIILEEVKNVFDSGHIEVDEHTGDLGSVLGRDLVDDWEEHLSKDVSLLLLTEVLELTHPLFQELHGWDRTVSDTGCLSWVQVLVGQLRGNLDGSWLGWRSISAWGVHGLGSGHLLASLLTWGELESLVGLETGVHLTLMTASLVHVSSSTVIPVLAILLLVEIILLILHIIHIPLIMVVKLIVMVLTATSVPVVVTIVLPSTAAVVALMPVVAVVSSTLPVTASVVEVLSLLHLVHELSLHLLEVLLHHHHHPSSVLEHLCKGWQVADSPSSREAEHFRELVLLVLLSDDSHVALPHSFALSKLDISWINSGDLKNLGMIDSIVEHIIGFFFGRHFNKTEF